MTQHANGHSHWAGALCLAMVVAVGSNAAAQEFREITLDELENRVRGGLAGQVVGVTYGAPTEFRWLGKMVEGEISWKPSMVRAALNQDDLYVEMTFVEVMDRVGLDATTEQYGDAFRDSKYNLWHANAGARRHLNNGVKAPMSGHPKYNIHANDIDFQIEADFIGLMTPGLPNETIKYCDRVGRVMNYGDGLYGGMFVCGMYSAAFFESDPRKLVEAGVACMPEGSGYRTLIEDVIATYDRYPDDWTQCWRIINEKWDKHDSCSDGALNVFNIDARLNGAYIAIGLLYGDGDFDRTLEISTRCGQDSDCNPASAAGVLGVVLGYEALDKKWVGDIPTMENEKFNFTDYTFNEMVDSTMKRALTIIKQAGGEVDGDRVRVPIQIAKAPKLEQWTMGVPIKEYVHTDDAWTWSGDWEKRPSRDYARRAAMVSRGGGNEAALEFEGTGLAIIGNLTQDGGRADVIIDDKKVGDLNAFIIERTTDSDLWHIYGLEDRTHSLRIVTRDEADPRSEGKVVAIHRAVSFRAGG